MEVKLRKFEVLEKADNPACPLLKKGIVLESEKLSYFFDLSALSNPELFMSGLTSNTHLTDNFIRETLDLSCALWCNDALLCSKTQISIAVECSSYLGFSFHCQRKGFQSSKQWKV